MQKNEIVYKIIDKLMEQREMLVQEIAQANFHETNVQERKMALEIQINNIDCLINSRINDLERINVV